MIALCPRRPSHGLSHVSTWNRNGLHASADLMIAAIECFFSPYGTTTAICRHEHDVLSEPNADWIEMGTNQQSSRHGAHHKRACTHTRLLLPTINKNSGGPQGKWFFLRIYAFACAYVHGMPFLPTLKSIYTSIAITANERQKEIVCHTFSFAYSFSHCINNQRCACHRYRHLCDHALLYVARCVHGRSNCKPAKAAERRRIAGASWTWLANSASIAWHWNQMLSRAIQGHSHAIL